MSILLDCDIGCLISTKEYFSTFAYTGNNTVKINENLFEILSPYASKTPSKRKQKKSKEQVNELKETTDFRGLESDVKFVQENYPILLNLIKDKGLLRKATETSQASSKNTLALETAEFVYEKSGRHLVKNSVGSNHGLAVIKTINECKYLFPNDCKFFSKDVDEIGTHLRDEKFDLILLDPPWWNKYIRRKKRKCPHAYNMMYNDDLKKIPVEDLLSNEGIVVVWCTNSPQHLDTLINDIFPKWNVQFLTKWFWLKVTLFGEPICEFSEPPGKQPFEQIIVGTCNPNSINLPKKNRKLIVSVPSAIHSHKPPLVEALQPFLPENPKCLEIFARYLLPNWTSYGNEVLRFQHESLYVFNE